MAGSRILHSAKAAFRKPLPALVAEKRKAPTVATRFLPAFFLAALPVKLWFLLAAHNNTTNSFLETAATLLPVFSTGAGLLSQQISIGRDAGARSDPAGFGK